MSSVIIYDYTDFSAYFKMFVLERKRIQPAFSVRYLCRRTKIKSPALFSLFATGKRLPSPSNLNDLAEVCNWSADECTYAEKMILLARARSEEEKDALIESMIKMRPGPAVSIMSHDAHEFTCQWYNNAILLLLSLKDFNPDPRWIVKRLGGVITEELATEAIERMQRLGLIEQRDGKIYKSHKHINISSEASCIRDFHHQLLEKAGEALESQSPKERPFYGYTVSLKKEKISDAAQFWDKMIAEFIKRYCSDDDPDEVYHLALQLFRLSEPIINEPTDHTQK